MRKKKRAALLLCCAALLLSGCMSPPDSLMRTTAEGQTLISASTAELEPSAIDVTLYFRWGDTAYLAPEGRRVRVERNESVEKAVVEAMIAGPVSPYLASLFPPGTEALAVSSQGDTLFITLNEAFLGRYADEPGDAQNEWKTEGPLRRQLCLDAMTAALTEMGGCAQVQYLVYRGAGESTSMRLPQSFLTRDQEDGGLLPAQTRREDHLLTPHNAAELVMRSWLAQDWNALYDMTALEGDAARPGEQTAVNAFASGSVLVGYTLSPGSVSLDGQRAVITATLSLRGDGRDVEKPGYPLRLVREGGQWKADYGQLLKMMEIE